LHRRPRRELPSQKDADHRQPNHNRTGFHRCPPRIGRSHPPAILEMRHCRRMIYPHFLGYRLSLPDVTRGLHGGCEPYPITNGQDNHGPKWFATVENLCSILELARSVAATPIVDRSASKYVDPIGTMLPTFFPSSACATMGTCFRRNCVIGLSTSSHSLINTREWSLVIVPQWST
jgi:hypothetical protein